MSIETINTANELDFSRESATPSPKKRNRQRNKKQKNVMSLHEFQATIPSSTQPRVPSPEPKEAKTEDLWCGNICCGDMPADKEIQKEETPEEAKTRRNRIKRQRAQARKAALKDLPQSEQDKRQGWTPVVQEKTKPKLRKPDPESIRGAQRVFRPVDSDVTNPNTTLVLKNLPAHCTTPKYLTKFFSKCGTVKHVNILKAEGKCRGIGFIKFETREGSDKGLDMDGFWYDDRKVYVEYSRNK